MTPIRDHVHIMCASLVFSGLFRRNRECKLPTINVFLVWREMGEKKKDGQWFFRWFPICVYRDSCPVLCRNRELLAKSPHHRTCGFSVLSIWISIKQLPSKYPLDSLILKDRWNKTNKWEPKLTSQSTSEASVALSHREVIENRSPQSSSHLLLSAWCFWGSVPPQPWLISKSQYSSCLSISRA